MKKSYRDIVVKGVTYGWKIYNNPNGDGSNWLKIWHDNKVIYEEKVEYNFDGDDSIQITPKIVRKRILETKLD